MVMMATRTNEQPERRTARLGRWAGVVNLVVGLLLIGGGLAVLGAAPSANGLVMVAVLTGTVSLVGVGALAWTRQDD